MRRNPFRSDPQRRLSDIGLLEFYPAGESIREGNACVKRMEAEIRYVVETRGPAHLKQETICLA